MTVLRPVLVGLGVGAAVAFLLALLGPGRHTAPAGPVRAPAVVDLPHPAVSRSTTGAT